MNAGVVCGVVLVVLVTLTEGQLPPVCNGNPELACSMDNPCYSGEECVAGCCVDVAATAPSSTCSDPEFTCYDTAGTYQCYEGETCDDATGCCVDVTTPGP